eukprot:762181-Hanusia_phi.AAC.6
MDIIALNAQEHSKKTHTIFFYFGNEDSVELYVNNTGLMWESATEFDAIMIFLEHRYYGKVGRQGRSLQLVLSCPVSSDTHCILLHSLGIPSLGCMEYLTTDQALFDAALFLSTLKVSPKDVLPKKWRKKPIGPIIGFGGSYGGMIASWFRMRFPHVSWAVRGAGAESLKACRWSYCRVRSYSLL